MNPKVAIILPVLDAMPLLKEMIKHLYESTSFPFKLIIIDGYSDDGTWEYCLNLLDRHENIELYQIPRKGLVNAINFGIKKAGNMDIYLTQADVIHFKLYGKDWLMNMHDNAQKKDIGIVIGINGGGISGPEFLEGQKWAGTWNTYIPKRTIEKIGLFDEQFSGGDDIDYSYRIDNAGLKGVMCNFWVQHHQLTDRNLTHKSDHLKKMGKLFKKKWGIK